MNVPAPGVLLGVGVALDVLWWLVADASLRRAGRRWPVRILVGLFAVAQAAWVVGWFTAPELDLAPPAPGAVDVAGLAWHAAIAPLALTLAVVGRGWALVSRRPA